MIKENLLKKRNESFNEYLNGLIDAIGDVFEELQEDCELARVLATAITFEKENSKGTYSVVLEDGTAIKGLSKEAAQELGYGLIAKLSAEGIWCEPIVSNRILQKIELKVTL